MGLEFYLKANYFLLQNPNQFFKKRTHYNLHTIQTHIFFVPLRTTCITPSTSIFSLSSSARIKYSIQYNTNAFFFSRSFFFLVSVQSEKSIGKEREARKRAPCERSKCTHITGYRVAVTAPRRHLSHRSGPPGYATAGPRPDGLTRRAQPFCSDSTGASSPYSSTARAFFCLLLSFTSPACFFTWVLSHSMLFR